MIISSERGKTLGSGIPPVDANPIEGHVGRFGRNQCGGFYSLGTQRAARRLAL